MDMIRYNIDEFRQRYGRTDIAEYLGPLAEFVSRSGPWIAGGAMRRWVQGAQSLTSDVDFFCSGESEETALRSKLQDLGYTSHGETEFNVSYKFDNKPDVQVIKLRSESVEQTLDRFDFTICQFGFDGHELIVGPYSLYDLARKRLAIHAISYPASSIRRGLKYASQGFTLCAGAATELLKQTVERPDMLNLDVEYVD